jgi:hypothetical protein
MKKSVCPFRLIRAGTSRSTWRPTYLIAILLALVSLVTPALSRTGECAEGSLHGTVSTAGPDGRSYSAPGAQVRLSGTSQDRAMSAVADDSGEYKFGSVPTGRYTLEVTLDGFENVTRPIIIHAGETTVENVKLEVKSVQEAVTAQAERVGLKMNDVEPASEIEQKTIPLLNVKGSRASQSGLTVNNTVRPNPYSREDRKSTLNLSGSHLTKPVTTYNAFNESAKRHFVSPLNQAVRLPGFFSLEVLKSYRLRVSPRVSLRNHGRRQQFPDVQGFYPRDFQGNLANANFGIFSNGVGRVFGMRFVIEKK